MANRVQNVAVLGSTGSIGQSALEVIGQSEGRLQAVALSGHTRLDLLQQQAQQFRPRWIAATDAQIASDRDWSELPSGCERLTGPDSLTQIASHPDVDIVLAAIVGAAGLESTWAALEAGKRVALANKETLVMAGPLVMELAERSGATLLPVDSEHSAVFQAMQAGQRKAVHRVILTASGGPFRNHTLEQLSEVTIDEALAHPTWEMGPKITIDSATMMNKALEMIEARWLFDLDPDQIEVMIHPQSVVHSFVEFVDGSVVGQLSPPDMKLPIQIAFDWPDRHPGCARRIDWSEAFSLDFEPADYERFGALQLGLEAARAGGTAGAVLNAANEAAVARFLDGRLRFVDIVPACRAVLNHHTFDPRPTLPQLLEVDRWSRKEVSRWVRP